MNNAAWSWRTCVAGFLVVVMTGCGGGGSSAPAPTPTPPPPPPPVGTAIPADLAIGTWGWAEAGKPGWAEVGKEVLFGVSTSHMAGFTYQWDFGNGRKSTESAVGIVYARSGQFDVVLKVTNEVGASREVRKTIHVVDFAEVRGIECAGAPGAGWCSQYARPTAEPTTSFFLNASTGWLGDAQGGIVKTTDGGKTWVRQKTGFEAVKETWFVKVERIHFRDSLVGWALLSNLSILRTTDGGASWAATKRRDGPVSVSFSEIVAGGANNVYVTVAHSGELSQSVDFSDDGGLTWRDVEGERGWNEWKGTWMDVDKAGNIWRIQEKALSISRDGGKTYTVSLPLATLEGSISASRWALHSHDAQRLSIIVTNKPANLPAVVNILTTADGGATWSRTVSAGGRYPDSVSADGKVLTEASSTSLSTDGGLTWVATPSMPKSASYLRSIGGSALALCAGGSFWMSEDDGRTWNWLSGTKSCSRQKPHRIENNVWLREEYPDSIKMSLDNGRTWNEVFQFGCYDDALVAFADAKTGFRACEDFKTKDGGVTWEPWTHGFGKLRSLQFLDKSNGWLVGGDGRLYKSVDAGQSWGAVETGANRFLHVSFSSPTLGWGEVDLGAGSSATVLTRDGGKTWETVPLEGVSSVRCREQHCVAVAYGAVHVSADEGRTWTEASLRPYFRTHAVALTGEQTIWAVGSGNRMAKSEDGGRTWTPVELPDWLLVDLNDIRFVDAKVGWVVGDRGRVLATRDGGKTWIPQPSGTARDLLTIQAADANTAWITTTNGGLLATGAGGH